jgi:hypothetical protein
LFAELPTVVIQQKCRDLTWDVAVGPSEEVSEWAVVDPPVQERCRAWDRAFTPEQAASDPVVSDELVAHGAEAREGAGDPAIIAPVQCPLSPDDRAPLLQSERDATL